jgi:hypothetical protein
MLGGTHTAGALLVGPRLAAGCSPVTAFDEGRSEREERARQEEGHP